MKSEGPSFTLECKEEIATSEFPFLEPFSLLSGFAWTSGDLKISSNKEILDLSSSSAQVAKCLYKCLSIKNINNARFSYTKGVGFAKKVRFHCLVDFTNDLKTELELDFFSDEFPVNNVETKDKAAAFVCGAFLAGGSVSNPISSNYHFEIATTSEHFAKYLCKVINRHFVRKSSCKVAKRKNQFIVYIKKSDVISEMLIFIGATASSLKFEEVRINRDFSNIYNRYANLDCANLNKTVKAGEKQVEQITFIDQKVGLENFAKGNYKLLILMKLRLAHQEASLNELASMLSEELACTVSKSNVNHLFRYIESEYNKLNEQK